jgi:hypothetical protein
MRSEDVSPWLARGIYLFGLALLITASIDLATTIWPIRPNDLGWRYGFLGLAAGYLQTPTLGLLLIIGTAIWQEHGGVLRATGMICLVWAALLLGAIGLFGLDVIQMRALRAEEARAGVLTGAVFQELKYFIAMCVLVLMGYGALRTAADLKSRTGRGPQSPGIISTPG